MCEDVQGSGDVQSPASAPVSPLSSPNDKGASPKAGTALYWIYCCADSLLCFLSLVHTDCTVRSAYGAPVAD